MPKEEFNLKKEYESISKKYKLPDFEALNNEFEFNIEKSNFLLRNIRRRMFDKMSWFLRIVENIIFPSQSHLLAYEGSFFDEEKRKELTTLHKKMMVFDRLALLLDTNPNDAEDEGYIKKLYKEWPSLKKSMLEIISIIKKSWESDLKEEDEKYFG